VSNKGRVSSIELLLSVAFLGIVVFFCYQMMMRQKRMVIKVNQNIEVTSLVHKMRNILMGVGCRENLAGFSRITPLGEITKLNNIVNFIDGTSSIEESFSTERGQGADISETGLELEGFELNPQLRDMPVRSDRTYLSVHFKRSNLKESMTRTIRIFTKDTNGVITDCSLVPFTEGKSVWRQVGDALVFDSGFVNLKAQNLKGKLNIEGGLFVTSPLGQCSPTSRGVLYYSPRRAKWMLCTQRGEVALEDERFFDE